MPYSDYKLSLVHSLGALLLFWASGCVKSPDVKQSPQLGACIEAHLSAAGFALGAENVPLALTVEATCKCDRGEGCDVGRFISVEAAKQAARKAGLEEGLADWRASLVYNHGYKRPLFYVSNTLTREGASAEGEGVSVDAVTGEVLEKNHWMNMPSKQSTMPIPRGSC